MTNKLIALVGPTGVGKTECSIKLARALNAEVISCDSMQIYKGMDIGTAKASMEEKKMVPHHLIDIKSPFDSYSVCDYVRDGKEKIRDIFSREKNALIVGGTGLYVDSLIMDTDFCDNAGSSEDLRQSLYSLANEAGVEAVHQKLMEIDPKSAKAIHPNNLKRVIRAIEYYELTGETFSYHNEKGAQKKSPYDYVYIGLTRNRDELYERIDKRVDIMLAKGLVDEVFALWRGGCSLKLTSMQALGYKEIIHYIEGKCSFNEAVRILKRDSRRYAKRQLTWFGRNKDISWINLSDEAIAESAVDICMEIIEERLKGRKNSFEKNI